MKNIKNSLVKMIIASFTIALFNIFLIILNCKLINIEGIYLFEYNLLFNTTIITQFKFYPYNEAVSGKKVNSTAKEESVATKSEPIISKSDSVTEKIDSTAGNDNIKPNESNINSNKDNINLTMNKNIFKTFFNKILTFVNTIKAKFSMFTRVISNNKYFYYLFKLTKFSLWITLYWLAGIGVVMFSEYYKLRGIDHYLFYNVYEAISLNIYKLHQNLLIYIKEYIESWITIDNNSNYPNLGRSSSKSAEVKISNEVIEELSRKNYRFDNFENEPFYKHPYFVLPVVIIVTALIAYGISKYLPEYFKQIEPKDLNPSDLDPSPSDGNLSPLPRDINTSPQINITDAKTDAKTPLDEYGTRAWDKLSSRTPLWPDNTTESSVKTAEISGPVASSSSSSLQLENVPNRASSSISVSSSAENTPVPSKSVLPSSDSNQPSTSHLAFLKNFKFQLPSLNTKNVSIQTDIPSDTVSVQTDIPSKPIPSRRYTISDISRDKDLSPNK